MGKKMNTSSDYVYSSLSDQEKRIEQLETEIRELKETISEMNTRIYELEAFVDSERECWRNMSESDNA
jgi:peptidoglycan hydrolase CwlO-like protein